MTLEKEWKNNRFIISNGANLVVKTSLFQEINAIISGNLTEEDEEAVDEEFAAILSEQMPEVPESEVSVEPPLPEVPTDPIQGNITKYFNYHTFE